MKDFVHLHNHTDYSLQDAAQTVQMMCNRVDDLGMDTIAVTEHGNLFSMVPFYKKAQKTGINAIIGCEIYVSAGKHNERKKVEGGNSWGYYHLVLLCMNEIGYKNLMKLVSIGYLDGFYYKPRVDKQLLKQYNEGLIATSACLAGEVTRFAANEDYKNCKKAALEYKEIFDDRFYIEIQNHGIHEELKSHPTLKKVSEELNIPLVATNDNHYCLEEHWEAHDVLFCLGTNADRNDPKRHRYEPRQFYIKSQDEMFSLFKDFPQALENTVKIAEQCKVDIPMGKYHLPQFPIPETASTESPDKYLLEVCMNGLKERYKDLTPELDKRLKYELSVIKNMGFAGYFLITQDFVKYAKSNQIPVGPGRGSAAGSLVAYCTAITDIDPLKYNLLFERFLNPDRISMPDIDIDFCIDGREKVINYIKERYGKDSVSQIITFGTMKAKSAVRDVGRVMGLSYGDVDSVAKMIPTELNITLDKALAKSKELKNIYENDNTYKELINFSKTLEGMHRHASTHAAGVVITPGPLTDYVPLFKSPSTGDIATQAEMNDLEDLGLLKVDILGLRNLTVIDKAIQAIKENHNKIIAIDSLSLDDQNVYKLFSQGKTIGIFQFESQGMREYLQQLNPTCIEDIIAMNALYRPGPMANIPKFIARKNGNEKIVFEHPDLENILKETHGIIVYQEQVMQIGSVIGGFTLAQSDSMRRAMGKKKADLMATFKIDFVNGAKKNGFDEKKAVKIFELLEKFAEYGFNKSHSVAYAEIAYQTAWLKVYYPSEFMAACLSSELNDSDRILTLISETKELGIKIIPPNINNSGPLFEPDNNGNIIYALSAIKNGGKKASENIYNKYKKNGDYKNLIDLCKIKEGAINKKTIESLIKSGACDSLEGTREQLYNNIENALKIGTQHVRERDSIQSSLFSADISLSSTIPLDYNDNYKWTDDEKLAFEKEVIGFYLTGNPLKKYEEDLNEFSNINLVSLPNRLPKEIKIGGIPTLITKRYDKKNRMWAILNLDGIMGKAEIFVFSDVYEKYKNHLDEEKPIFIIGTPSNRMDGDNILKFIAKNIYSLNGIRERLSKYINIKIDKKRSSKDDLDFIKSIASKNKGKCNIILHLESGNGIYDAIKSRRYTLIPSIEVICHLRDKFGVQNIWIS